MKDFTQNLQINYNDNVDTREGAKGKKLSYLTFPFIWGEVKQKYPDAEYIIHDNPKNDLGIFGDPAIGYEVRTSVLIEGKETKMWLPVLDHNQNPMKGMPYDIQTKYGKTHVDAIDAAAINKSKMRCLVKNIAFASGLGLYIYNGEDLPPVIAQPATKAQIKEIIALGGNAAKITFWAGTQTLEQLTQEQAGIVLTSLRQAAEKAAAKAAEEKKKREEEQKKKEEEEQTRKEAEKMFDIPTEEDYKETKAREKEEDPRYAPVLDDNGQEVDWEEGIRNV